IEETDFIGGSAALRTVANNESLLMGAYEALGTEMAIRLNGVFSDELRVGEFYNAQTTHEWLYAPADIGLRDNYTATTPLYRVIDRANRVLEALPDAIAESDADEALRERVRGEALFLRAFSHFELFRYYCGNYDAEGLGMPYMELPSLDNQARIGMGEYFEKMLRDINEAKPLLADDLSDIYRANRLSAVALHARVALYMRQWNDAITYATEYIEAIPLSSREDFPGIWTDDNDNELSWKLNRTTANRVGSIYRSLFTRNSSGALVVPSTISWTPSNKLWDAFDQENDVRFGAYLIDEPLLAAVANKPHRLVNKYAGTGYATTNENVADLKIFRTAEMYLIRPEARSESGAFSGVRRAESDINELRMKPSDGYENVTFASSDEAIEAVLFERFKELAFEGHRFWDLKRRELPVVRTGDDVPSNQGTTLPANHFRFVLPIPQPEIQANPLMEQNPGYGSN